MRLPWRPDNPNMATLPMALLTAIVRKEALLPEHTAAFAATQLLPVIQGATDRHLAVTPRQVYHPDLCKELLVSADMPSPDCCCCMSVPHARPARSCTLLICMRSAKHGCALQMMCSTLATSSAWPVLLGHRDLITLAADMVFSTYSKGDPCPLTSLSVSPSDPSRPSPVCLRNSPAGTPLNSCHPAQGY